MQQTTNPMRTQNALPTAATANAASQFMAEVRKIQNSTGCSYDEAWARATTLFPTLYAAQDTGHRSPNAMMASAPQTKRTPAAQASIEFQGKVREIQTSRAMIYNDAWNAARLEYPELFAKMEGGGIETFQSLDAKEVAAGRQRFSDDLGGMDPSEVLRRSA